jgi:hypothetical protein
MGYTSSGGGNKWLSAVFDAILSSAGQAAGLAVAGPVGALVTGALGRKKKMPVSDVQVFNSLKNDPSLLSTPQTQRRPKPRPLWGG